MRTTAIASALLGLGASAYAQSVSASQGGITYAFSVPETSASSDSGDIYISISAPTSYSWVGLGSGSQMSGAKMFVIYQNAAGTNVTLSPRTGTGEVQPKFDSSAQATLAAGTGVSNGVMTAVIKCSDCASKYSITSSSASLIYAALAGSAIKSDDQSYSISQHSNTYGTMTVDMTKAKNSANNNPFVNGTTTTSSSSGSSVSCVPATSTSGNPSQTTGGYYGPFGSGHTGRPSFATGTGFPFARRADTAANACPSGYVPASSSNSGASFNSNNGFTAEQQRSMLMAHGIMAGLAFAVLFPFGAISIRLLSFPGLVAFHAIFQICAYLFYIIAFGLGAYLANQMKLTNAYHPILGILLFVLVLFQPILGWMHHRNFKRFQRRTLPSYAHVWLGRIVITLGIINGGLGFLLANNTRTGPIAYGIIAAIFFVAYVASIFIGERRRKQNHRNMPPKYEDVLLQDNSPHRTPPVTPPRHREFYAGGRPK